MEEIRIAEIKAHLKRARKDLESAEVLFEKGLYEGSLTKSYFAMFHAALAALLALGVRAKKHGAVIALFGEHLTRKGWLDPSLHRALAKAMEARIEADYNVFFEAGSQTARSQLEEAKAFLEAIRKFLQERGIAEE